MLDAAKDNQKPINFNADYSGSRETIVNGFPVNPAFSKIGYGNFAKQLQNPDKYLYGDKWVLGNQALANYDKAAVLQAVATRYNGDFIKTWTGYLNATSVVPYRDVPDAAKKLSMMSGPQSTLLQVLCVASENTSVPAKDLAAAFQPVQSVTPPGCLQQLIGPSNTPYMQSLVQLQGALQAVGPIANADPNNVTAGNNAATQADSAVSTLAFKFAPSSPVVSKTGDILRAPIRGVSSVLKGAGAGPVNAAAGGMCASVQPILGKYPFNPKSQQDATLEEVNGFLNPQTGSLWALYNNSLKQFLIPSGNDYIPATGQPLAVTPPFLRFFNRAAHLSRALYATNPAQPSFTFPGQVLPSPDVTHVTLTIDGQMLSTDLKSGAKSQSFNWPGQTPGVSLGVAFGGGAEGVVYQTSSPWGIWRFLDTAEHPVVAGNQIQVEWVQRTSAGPIMYSGHPEAVKFAFDSPILRPQYFSGLSCVSKAVQ
jgi:type VI secretion system protein ImpL